MEYKAWGHWGMDDSDQDGCSRRIGMEEFTVGNETNQSLEKLKQGIVLVQWERPTNEQWVFGMIFFFVPVGLIIELIVRCDKGRGLVNNKHPCPQRHQ